MPGIYETIQLSFTPTPKVAAEIQRFTLEMLREVTPVRTGALRAGWSVTVSGASVEISNDVFYAAYVDGGTRKMRARDMTGQAEAAVEPFAERRSELAKLLAAEPELKFQGTGDAKLDAEILAAASAIVGDVTTSRKQTGLFDVGSRTLKTFNDAARIAQIPGASPRKDNSRATVLQELYGQVAEAFGVTGTVETSRAQ